MPCAKPATGVHQLPRLGALLPAEEVRVSFLFLSVTGGRNATLVLRSIDLGLLWLGFVLGGGGDGDIVSFLNRDSGI